MKAFLNSVTATVAVGAAASLLFALATGPTRATGVKPSMTGIVYTADEQGNSISAERGIHLLFAQLLPGFNWITWPSFFLGLLWSIVFGWYIAVLFAPLFNFFAERTQ